MEVRERIRALRKHLKMTQDAFSSRLGITKSGLSGIESGTRGYSEQVFRSICREFCVNEEWLRTGEGEMFPPRPRAEEIETELRRILSADGDSIRERIVSAMLGLTEEQWEAIEAFALKIVGDRIQPRQETIEEEARREAEEFYQKRLAEKKRELSISQAAENGNAG